MFSGIIYSAGKVSSVQHRDGGIELQISADKDFPEAKAGDSVAVNGVCLTVESATPHLRFNVVPETITRSTLGGLQSGELVNLEPSLHIGDPVGGHFVYGHVDTTCEILSKEREGQGFRIWCSLPKSLAGLIVEKGFVALDGVSLTVAAAERDKFAVALVPETLKRTTLGRKGPGVSLNIEADPLARYVAAQMQAERKNLKP